MKHFLILSLAMGTILSSIHALAAEKSLDKLADQEAIAIRGTVEEIADERKLVIRDDASESIDVEIKSDQSLAVKEGDIVTVKGVVDKGLIGTEIDASEVKVEKPLLEEMNDRIKAIPGIPSGNAQPYFIADLPDEGLVKISGTVSEVDSQTAFTLIDHSGSINVTITSDQRALLTKKAQVSVIGYVDEGLLTKTIEAEEILVSSEK